MIRSIYPPGAVRTSSLLGSTDNGAAIDPDNPSVVGHNHLNSSISISARAGNIRNPSIAAA